MSDVVTIQDQVVWMCVWLGITAGLCIAITIILYFINKPGKDRILHTHNESGVVTITHDKTKERHKFSVGDVVEIRGTESINGLRVISEVMSNQQFKIMLTRQELRRVATFSNGLREGVKDTVVGKPKILRIKDPETISKTKMKSAKVAPVDKLEKEPETNREETVDEKAKLIIASNSVAEAAPSTPHSSDPSAAADTVIAVIKADAPEEAPAEEAPAEEAPAEEAPAEEAPAEEAPAEEAPAAEETPAGEEVAA